MNADGSGATQLVPLGAAHQLVLDWGAPGILYRDYDTTTRAYALWVVPPGAPATRTRLLPATYNVTDARYSPDGSKIAFIGHDKASGSTVNYVWVANANGTGITKLTTDPVLVPSSLDWRTDGSTTYYNTLAVSARASGQTAEYKIYTLDLSASPVTATARVQSINLMGTDFVSWGLLNPVNSPPVTSNVTLNTPEDTSVTVTLTATDDDGDNVTFAITAPPAHGTLGSWSAPSCGLVGSAWTCTTSATYTPDLNYYGPDTLTFTATDTASLTSPASTVNITVAPVNDRPVVTGKTYATTEDAPLVIAAPGLLTGATDVELSPLVAQGAVAPAHGTLSIAANGSFTYTPNANYHGTDTFAFVAHDGTDASLPGTVTITVTPVNDAPTATADTYSTNENTTLTVAAPGVLANDADVDGDVLTASQVTGPTNGTLTLNGNGSFTYTPNPAYNGPDSFTYRVSDGTLNSAAVTVTLSVLPVNDPPVNTVPGAQTTNEDSQLVFSGANGNSISVADIDAGSAPVRLTLTVNSGTLTLGSTAGLTFTSGTGTANASMTFQGTLASINAALDGLRFDPVTNSTAAVTLTITANDQGNTGTGGALTDTDTVAINVQAVNDAPVNSAPASVAATEDTDLVFTAGNRISVNDVDAGVQPVRVTLTATNGTLTLSGVAGLTFTTGTGTGDTTMTFAGTQASVNTALNNLRYSPTGNYSGPATLTISTDDQGNTGTGGALLDSDTVAITVAAVNDAPVNTVPGPLSTNENTALVFSGINAVQTADVDAGAAPVRVTLAATNGTLTLSGTTGLTFTTGDGTNDASLTFTGSLADVNTALNGLTFNPTPNFGGAASVALTVNDQGNTGSGGALSDSDTVSITVVSVNDAPVITNPGPQSTNEDVNIAFTAANSNLITVSDVDAASAPVAVTLTATNGRVILGSTAGLTGLSGNGTASVSFTASIASLNTALNGMAFAPTAQYNGAATLTILVNDQGNTGTGGAQSDTETINITVVAVNDAPVNTVPGAQTTNEDTALPLILSTVDQDAGSAPVAVTLTATNGTLSLAGTSGLAGLAGNGTNSVTFTGAVADVNAALNGLTFTPNNGYTGPATITLVVNDQGNTGTGGAQSDTDTINVTVTAVNDAPVNTVPGAQTVAEDTNLVFSPANLNAISTADSDAGAANVTVTLAATNGQLTLGATTGLIGLAGNGTGTVTFAGSLANVNTALNGLTFRGAANYNGPATVTFTLNDQGNTGTGGPLTDTDTVNITVTAVNDAPANAVPGAQSTTENTALVFLAANSNAITISDVDAGSAPVAVTLTVTNGTLTLGSTTGLVGLAGNGTASVTFTGTLADTNSALSGLSYNPTAAYNGPATLTVAVSDQGNTGSGGPQTDSDTVAITVLPVNDPPVNTVPGAQTITEDATLTFAGATLMSVSDVDAGAASVAVTLTATNGTLALGSTAGLTGLAGNGTGTITFTAPLANVNTALNGTVFTPTQHFSGSATVTLTVNDQGNTGGGGAKSDTDSVAITITAVNDAPTNTVPAAQSVNEDGTLVFSTANSNRIFTADVDAGSAQVAVTLTATNGNLTLGSTAGLTGLAGNGTATVTFGGTVAQVNTALAGLAFAPTGNYTGPATVTIAVNDQGNTGSGGAQSDTDTVNITVAAVNDGPQNTVPGAQTTNENVALVFSTANLNAIATNDIDAGASPLAVTLTATNGTLTLGSTAGISGLAGNGTASVTFTGTVAQVNAALNGLSFTPAFSFGGTATVTIAVNDQGNTGTGGPLTDTDTVNITVNAINDAPVNTVPGAQTTNEDVNLVFSAANMNLISTSDIDAGAAPVAVTLTATNGTLTLGATTGLVGLAGNNSATVTFTGTLTNVNNALSGLTFRPTLNYSGAASVTLTVNDQGNSGGGGPQTDTDTVSITVTAVNDAPQNTVPGAQSTNEDTDLPLALSTSDVDAGSSAVAVTLTVNNGTLTLGTTTGLAGLAGNGTNTITFTGDLASVNPALGSLTFSPTGNYTGPATLTLTVNDQGNAGSGGPQSDTDTVAITVTAVNDAPVNTVPGAQTINEDATYTFVTLQTSDPDVGASALAVTLTATNGTLTLGGTTGLVGLAGNGTGTITFTGTLANVNSALNGTTFTPGLHYNGPATVTLTVNDQGNTGTGGPRNDSDTVNFTVTAVNDGPVVTVPGAQSIVENAPAVFSPGNGTAITVGDLDAGSAPVAMTLSATNGTLTLAATTGLSGLAGNGTTSVTFTGSLTDVNAALNGLTFNPTAAYNGPATVTVTVSDQGNTGSGGPLTDSKTINLTVLPVNDAPVNTVPGAQTTNEDQIITFNSISTSDVDAGGAAVAVTVSATNGTLTLGSTAGISGLAGNGTASVTFTGTVAQVNTALNGLTFTPTLHFNGAASVTLSVNDQGNTGGGGAKTDTDTVNITVTAVNDAPSNTVPAAQTTNEDTDLPLSLATTDVDAGASPVAVTLTSTNGTLTLGSTAGLVGLSGNNSNSITFTGTLANVNTAIATVTFKPTPNYAGPASVTLTVNDQGNSGSGGPQSDTDTINITVSAVNDAPQNSVPGAQTTDEDVAISFTTISVTDVDAGSSPVAVTLTATNGTLTLGSTGGLSGLAGNGTNTVTFTGTLANVNTALNGLTFTPNPGFGGAASLTMLVNDQGNTGSGGPQTDSDTVNITVNAVNDAPQVTVPGAQTVNEDQTVTFTGATAMTVSDSDAGSAQVSVTLAATNGRLNLGSTTGLAGLVGNGTGSVTFTGTLTNVNTALNGMIFTPTLHYNGSASVTLTVNDQGNTGSGGAQTASGTVNITLNPVNDAPVNSVPGAQTVNEDAFLTLNLSTNDVDAGAGTLAVTLASTNGTLSLGSTTGLVGLAGNGTNSVTFTATLANVNGALTGLAFTPTAQYNGPATLTLTVNDQGNAGSGGPLSDSDTVNITVAAVNDPPVNTVPGAQTINEDQTLTFSGATAISTTDPDLGAGTVAVTLTAANGTLNLGGTAGLVGLAGNGGATVTFSGTLANVNSALNGLTFTPTLHYNGSASVTIAVSDQGNTGAGGPLTATNTVNITINAVNDAPTIAVPAPPTTAENTAHNFTNTITVSDVDAGSSPVAVTLTSTNGTLTLGSTAGLGSLVGNGTGNITFTGTIAQVNTALNGLTFTPTTSFTGTATVTVGVNDQGNTGAGGAQSATASVTVNVLPVNDPPVITAPAAQAMNEDANLFFNAANSNAITVSDVDAGSAAVAVTLASTNGTLTLGSTAGLGSLVGNGTGNISFTGTVAQVNTALNGLRYSPTTNYYGSATVTITVNDQGNTGAGGPQTDSETINITINGINDAPTISGAGAQTINEDAPYTFSALATADVDAGSGQLQITLAATNGTLTLGSTAGLGGLSGNGTGSISFTGTVAQTNAALSGMVYTPTLNYSGTGSVALTVNDQGNTGAGGPQTAIATVNFTINAVNDPPQNSVPGAQSGTEDTPVVFSGANAITTSDVDAGSNSVRVTLSVTNGTLTLGSTAGLGSVVGNGTASVTFTGTVANVSSAMSGLTYSPTQHFNGAATLTITTNDQGFTGSGGAQSDTDMVTINLAPVNDVPILNAIPALANIQDGAFRDFTLTATDYDGQSLTFNATTPPTKGTLSFGTVNCSVAGGTSTCTVTVRYTANAGASGADSFVIRAFDGTASSNLETGTINVEARTQLVVQNLTNIRYNQTVTLQATLTTLATGTPISGATVSFTVGSTTVTGTTNGSGVATASYTVAVVPGTHNISASYGGATNTYAAASGTGTLTVIKDTPTLSVAVTPSPLQFSDRPTIVVTATSFSTPVSGLPITVVLNANGVTTTLGPTNTLADGTVTFTPAWQNPVGASQSLTVTASTTGNTYFDPASTGAQNVSHSQETGAIINPVMTNPGASSNYRFEFQFQETNDGSTGNVANPQATVTIIVEYQLVDGTWVQCGPGATGTPTGNPATTLLLQTQCNPGVSLNGRPARFTLQSNDYYTAPVLTRTIPASDGPMSVSSPVVMSGGTTTFTASIGGSAASTATPVRLASLTSDISRPMAKLASSLLAKESKSKVVPPGLEGKPIFFYLDGQFVGEAPIGPDGTARLEYRADLPAGRYVIRAEFLGHSVHGPASGTGSLTVTARQATLQYLGDLSPTGNDLNLKAGLAESQGGGDLTRATLVFTLADSAGAPVAVHEAAVGPDGTAVQQAAGLAPGTYQVTVALKDERFFSAQPVTVEVTVPAPEPPAAPAVEESTPAPEPPAAPAVEESTPAPEPPAAPAPAESTPAPEPPAAPAVEQSAPAPEPPAAGDSGGGKAKNKP